MDRRGMNAAQRRTMGMLESHVQGTPCFIEVDEFVSVAPWTGSAHTCPSRDDYYGYTEIEFSVYDRKGYRAKWLEAKLDGDDIERIEQEIIDNKRGE